MLYLRRRKQWYYVGDQGSGEFDSRHRRRAIFGLSNTSKFAGVFVRFVCSTTALRIDYQPSPEDLCQAHAAVPGKLPPHRERVHHRLAQPVNTGQNGVNSCLHRVGFPDGIVNLKARRGGFGLVGGGFASGCDSI